MRGDYHVKAEQFKEDVKVVLKKIEEMLISKNKHYGDSALDPIRIFSKAPTEEQIRVRIDDKLKRIDNCGNMDPEDSIDDLIGYLVLLKIAQRRESKLIEEKNG
jgi:hypothetical protein